MTRLLDFQRSHPFIILLPQKHAGPGYSESCSILRRGLLNARSRSLSNDKVCSKSYLFNGITRYVNVGSETPRITRGFPAPEKLSVMESDAIVGRQSAR